MAYVIEANEKYEEAADNQEKCALAQETGCKGSYSFSKLPLHDRILDTPVDPMHLVKNIVEHCVRFVTGTEDSSKVRQEEKVRNRFSSAWISDDNTSKLPPAPFSLCREEVLLADERAKSILVPSTFDWRPRPIFSKKAGMKAHEWKEVVTNGILKFCLRGMLGRNQRKTLYKLFDVITRVCAEDVVMDTIDNLEEEVHRALAFFERDFPISLQVIVFHLLHHLPAYVKRFGPVYGFWMYPYERFNSWISRRVLNKRYPESTVIETYRLCEWANFMEVSGQLTEGATSMLLCFSDQENGTLFHVEGDVDKTEEEYVLTDEELEELKLHYINSVPEYNELFEQYKKERERSKVSHHLRSFPRFCEWQPEHSCPLTPELSDMLTGPLPIVTRVEKFAYQDLHGRKIKFSTVESEREYLCRRCSYVSAEINGVLTFGQILTIFRHTFLSTTTVFVYASWFADSVKDQETNLMYVLTTIQTQSVLPIRHLKNI